MQFLSNYSLKSHNSFGFDIRARWWAQAKTLADIGEALVFTEQQSLPLMVLGEGSNLVLTEDYPGLVLNICVKGKSVIREDGDYAWVSIGAGENWDAFVRWCLENRLYGVENLIAIPGTVGAAPVQNIGAYGVELVSCFDSLEAVARDSGEVRVFHCSDCEFGYRDSVFKGTQKDRYIILRVVLKLSKTPQLHTGYGEIEAELTQMDAVAEPASVAQAVARIRARKLPDPQQLGNAGSFFKNPLVSRTRFEELRQKYPDIVGYDNGDQVKLAAGWLVDFCGWKGFRHGDAGVHSRQALVLVNHGSATGADIIELAERVKASVAETFGVSLELEPRVYP